VKPSLPLCLTDGRHTPGSPWEAECPIRAGGLVDQKRTAGKASAAARRLRRHGGSKGSPLPAPVYEQPGNVAPPPAASISSPAPADGQGGGA